MIIRWSIGESQLEAGDERPRILAAGSVPSVRLDQEGDCYEYAARAGHYVELALIDLFATIHERPGPRPGIRRSCRS